MIFQRCRRTRRVTSIDRARRCLRNSQCDLRQRSGLTQHHRHVPLSTKSNGHLDRRTALLPRSPLMRTASTTGGTRPTGLSARQWTNCTRALKVSTQREMFPSIALNQSRHQVYQRQRKPKQRHVNSLLQQGLTPMVWYSMSLLTNGTHRYTQLARFLMESTSLASTGVSVLGQREPCSGLGDHL